MAIEWQWGNAAKLHLALDHVVVDEVRDDLLDALDAVLEDPFGPWSSPMRGDDRHADRMIAAMPHGFYLVFTPYPNGCPPVMSPVLVVRAFYRLPRFDL